jgi:hypothetical protein
VGMNDILALDSSFTSPGLVYAFIDNDKMDIDQIGYLGFTTCKKYEHNDAYQKIIYYNKKAFNSDIEQYLWLRNQIIDNVVQPTKLHTRAITELAKISCCVKPFPAYVISPKELKCKNFNWVAIEDYAFACAGQLTKLAETCGCFKTYFFEQNIPIRLYEIHNIKRFATGNGAADKIMMEETFEKIPIKDRIDLSFLPLVSEKKTGNPKDNIVDAYFIMKFLQTELKVRKGLIRLQDLSEAQIKCFNYNSKARPLNLLVRPFIQKIQDNN